MKKRVDALTITSGPTISGIPSPNGNDLVGGDVLPIDKLALFLSQNWVLFLLFLLPLSLLLYKNRRAVFPSLHRLLRRR